MGSPRVKSGKAQEISHAALHRKQFIAAAAALFVICYLYIAFLSSHILSFQEEQFLFIFSGEYLKERALIPGGILEYAGRFLSQFYEIPVLGALILTAVIFLPGFLTFKIARSLNCDNTISYMLALLPPAFLLLMQRQYFNMLEHSLGYTIVLACILGIIKFPARTVPLLLFPVAWYIAGAFALALPVAYFLFALASGDRKKQVTALILVVVAAITFFVFRNVLFVVSGKQLVSFPLPLIANSFHRTFFVLASVFVIILPALSVLVRDKGSKAESKKYAMVMSSGFVVIVTAVLVIRINNPMISEVLKIQDAAYDGRWEDVIGIHEKHHSGNLVSEYFYNIALTEKGLLCEKLFSKVQVFGTDGLILPWGNEHLERGAYFFYATGLVNEAFRWAYEEMVVYGLRPHNIRMLIKSSLVAGNYKVADKYIDILSKTLFYRKEAERLRKLSGDPAAIAADSEMGPISRIMPQSDFFIYTDKPEENLPALFDSNNSNRRAFEYMTVWLLLEKDIETALSNIRFMPGMGYKRLPRYLEEAVMIFYNSQGTLPDLSGYSISTETMNRFNQYSNAFRLARNNPATTGEVMQKRFGDTYWYYVHFGK